MNCNLRGFLQSEEHDVLVRMATDMVCFGAIQDMCPQCNSHLMFDEIHYICARNVIGGDLGHTDPFKALSVIRVELKYPKKYKKNSVFEKLKALELGKPRERIFLDKEVLS